MLSEYIQTGNKLLSLENRQISNGGAKSMNTLAHVNIVHILHKLVRTLHNT